MQKSALLAAFLLCAALLPAQAPQYFFQKLDCDTGNTMCFDADSNIWLGCSRAGQPLLVKMSRAGILLEQVQINTGAGFPNHLTDLMFDSEGMLVGCGFSQPIDFNTPEPSFAFRYDPQARQLLWSRKLNDGFLFANGLVEKGPGSHFWVYCYRANLSSVADILLLDRNTGALVPGGSRAYQMGNDEDIRSALYHKGKLYTTGTNDLSYLYGITVRRYRRQSVACMDTAGIPVWTLLGSVPLTARSSLIGQDLLVENDTLVSLASGNDLTNATTSSHLFLQKTTLDGTPVWLKKYDVTGTGYSTETGASIASVPDGYLILGHGGNGGGVFILKTDKNGNLLWAQKFSMAGIAAPTYGKMQSQMLTDGDAIYLIGTEAVGLQSAAVFAKIDRNGNIAGCNRLSPLTVLPVPLSDPFFEKRDLQASTADAAVSEETPSDLPLPVQLGISVICQNEGPAPQNPCEPRTFLRRLGTDGQRQWVTCLRTAPDSALYLGGRRGDLATLTKMRPDGEVLWARALPAAESLTVTDLTVDSEGKVVGCGHRGDAPTGRRGFAFRYDPLADQLLWLQNFDDQIVSGGGIVETNAANRNLLLYETRLLPDGRQMPGSVLLSRATGGIVPLSGRRYDAETHSQVFNAAALDGNDLYAVGQDLAASGRQRMMLSNLTIGGGGQKWTQVGHADTTAAGSFGGYGAVIFDQSHILSAYTGHPTASGTAAPTQLFLQKTAPLGTVLWVRRYEVPLLGEVDLLAVPGGYVLLGKTSPTQYALLKTDLNGNLLAAKRVDFGTAGGTPVLMEKTQHRIALLGEHLFFALHDGRADVAFLLKTDLNLEVQGPCNGVAALTLPSGNVTGPVARRLSQGPLVLGFASAPATAVWQPDDLASALICPPPVVVPRLALGPDRGLCPGQLDTLKAPAGFVSYRWQDGSTGLQLIVADPGVYSVATTDICDRVQRDTVLVTMLTNPVKSVTLALSPLSSVNLGGDLYFAPDTVTVPEPSLTGGCDTLTTYFLEICPPKTGTDTISFYPGQKVTLGGNNYTQPGTVVLQFFTAGGCDSTVTYTLRWIPTSVTAQCSADLTLNAPLGTDRAAVEYPLPTFSTDCPDQDVLLLLLEGPYTGDTFPLGTTRVCYLAFSNCGARDTCCFSVTVLPPAEKLDLLCPPSLTVTAPADSSSTTVAYALPSATTDCTDPTIATALLQGLPSGAAFPVGSTQVCYEAANQCGIRDTCCFSVTVLPPPPADPPCDIKTPPGCLRYELLGIRLDSLGQRRYRVRMVNTCASPLRFAYLQLPNGVVAVSPKQGATYTAPGGNAYAVRNPNASPFYSVRYQAVAGNVSGGAGDVFEYTLPQQAAPAFLHVAARLADGSFSEAYLNVQVCPVEAYAGMENLELKMERTAMPAHAQFSILNSPLSVWPNPTDGRLLADLSAWQGQSVLVRVLNGQGQLVLERGYVPEREAVVVDLPEGLASGLYYLTVQAGEQAAAVRFVVEQ